MTQEIWVLPEGDRWAIREAGNQRPSAIFEKQLAAVTIALNLANETGATLIVVGANGKIPGFTTTATIRRKRKAFPS